MSNPFLPPPPTNETLVVAEFTRHLEQERLERRRMLPRVIGRNALLGLALVILFAISGWIASHIVDAMSAHSAKVHVTKIR